MCSRSERSRSAARLPPAPSALEPRPAGAPRGRQPAAASAAELVSRAGDDGAELEVVRAGAHQKPRPLPRSQQPAGPRPPPPAATTCYSSSSSSIRGSARRNAFGSAPAQRRLKLSSDGIRDGLQRFRCISLRSAALHGVRGTLDEAKCTGFHDRSVVERIVSGVRVPPPPLFSR